MLAMGIANEGASGRERFLQELANWGFPGEEICYIKNLSLELDTSFAMATSGWRTILLLSRLSFPATGRPDPGTDF